METETTTTPSRHALTAIAAIARESSDPDVKDVVSAKEKEDAATLVTGATGMSSLRPNFTSRKVTVPEGKLGIVIDTTVDGPLVHSVKPTSPLFGRVFPGDIVASVDDIDTHAMTAVELTDLFSSTSDYCRELTVLSQDMSC